MKWSLIFTWFLLTLCCTLGEKQKACEFPIQWRGKWFQSGVSPPVAVNTSIISSKGLCISVEGDKFFIKDLQDDCHRCIVMHEKHPNVLQYKETFCIPGQVSFGDTCDSLTGDAVLYSLFRLGATSSPCPIKGPLEFTYKSGEDDCSSPSSLAETCTQESRLLLRYQACASAPRTESTVVELECLATWKEGSTNYLVARLHGERIANDENRYRCFVYHKAGDDKWTLAQSGDASCTGLTATEGARMLNMRQKPAPKGCDFPSWVVSERTGVWVALDSMSRLLVSPRNLTILDQKETQLVCHNIINTDIQPSSPMQMVRGVMLVAKATRDCENGYVCLVFHKRDHHVIEMQLSKRWSQQFDEACKSSAFNPVTTPYTTFIASEPTSRQCPYLGRYEVVSTVRSRAKGYAAESLGLDAERNVGDETVHARAQEVKLTPAPTPSPRPCHHASISGLDIGCKSPDRMELSTTCRDDALSVYSCHGTWEENGTAYLVASTETERYCIVYSAYATNTASTDLTVTSHLASCPRASHSHTRQHVWQVNLTAHARCDATNSALATTSHRASTTIWHLLLVAFLGRYIAR